MRVLIIVPEYPTAVSPGYQFVHDRVKEYQGHFDVDVFCCRSDQPEGYQHEGVSVLCGSTSRLIRLIGSGRYSHFVIHYLTLVNAVLLLTALRNKRTFLWFHGSDCLNWRRRLCRIDHHRRSGWRGFFWARKWLLIMNNGVRSLLIKTINRCCKQLTIVFVSHWGKMAAELDNHEAFRRAEVIPNFVNAEKFPYHTKKPDDRFRVLSISSFATDFYGGDILRDVLLAFSHEPLFAQFQFDIYGDGVLFDEVTAPLRDFDNIHVRRGYLSHEQIALEHRRHGIFLYPKRGDTQGVSRCEAMLSGVVPLASDVEAISEYSPDHTSFLAVTVEDFLAAFKHIDDDPEGFLTRSKAGAEFIGQKCSYAATIQREIDLLTRERSVEKGSEHNLSEH